MKPSTAGSPRPWDAFAELWYKHSGGSSCDWRRCASRHYDGSRYHLLNLHAAFSTERPARTIEFRAFNATLHAERSKVTSSFAWPSAPLPCTASRQAPHGRKQTIRNTPSAAGSLRLGFIGEEFETARIAPDQAPARKCRMATRRLSPPDDGLDGHQPETLPGVAGKPMLPNTPRRIPL